MINSVTTFLFIKPTISFAFNFKRLFHLTVVPFAVIFMVLLAESHFPLFYLAQTAELKLEVNFYMLAVAASVFLFLAFSLMLYIQKIVFFGEPVEDKKFFVPFLNRSFISYFAQALYILINAFFFGLMLAYLIISILNYFVPMAEKINLYRLLATGILWPYFMIRFSMCLPAAAADQKIKFWTSWKMTRRISPFMALVYAMFLLFPLTFVAIAYTFLGQVIGNEEIVFFIINLSSLLSLFFSCILYSAYTAYLYSGILSAE